MTHDLEWRAAFRARSLPKCMSMRVSCKWLRAGARVAFRALPLPCCTACVRTRHHARMKWDLQYRPKEILSTSSIPIRL